MLSRCSVLLLFLWAAGARADEERISYNFQVRPILAEHCFKCHGQDAKQRKAKLRLDDRDSAVAKKAILPGNAEDSEAARRMVCTDPKDLMPPPKERRPLTPAEITLLRRWIDQGATYEKHWAFIPPVQAPVPVVPAGGAVHNPIDPFVLARLAKEGLSPAPPARKEEWLRRVTFDLTGLPPTLKEIDAYLADVSSLADETVVDRLLDSTGYGEHMATEWMDAARYADTYGRHEDDDSTVWPWRDWVVKAFNQNLPYDKFILWQTAGDMLPGATQEMYLATAFNRLVQMSNEAGSNEAEFRQELVVDRLNTNGTALLGLSVGCARCHDHKYDPITQRDYYSMSAFLNNIDELGLYSRFTEAIPAPSIFAYEGDAAQRHLQVKLAIAAQEQKMRALRSSARHRFEAWMKGKHAPVDPPKPLVRLDFESLGDDKVVINSADPSKPGQFRLRARLVPGHSGKGVYIKGDNVVAVPGVGDYTRTHPFSASLWLKVPRVYDRAVVFHHSRSGLDAASRGFEVILEDNRPSFALAHFWPGNGVRIRALQAIKTDEWTNIACTYDGSSRASGMRLYFDGEPVPCEVVRDNLYKDIVYDKETEGKDDVENARLSLAGRYNDKTLRDSVLDEFQFFDRELSPVEIRLATGVGTWTREEEWFDWWLRERDEAWRSGLEKLQALRDDENVISMNTREVMVMKEMPGARRPTFILTRGKFDAPADAVQPDTPAGVFPFPKDFPRNRLGYAKWLVDRRNPLTARVYVNRVWQMFFGRGIVLTSEDFGVQGQLPTHPQLLDWLAVWFMDHGWDVKKLCRLIALSGAYRQSSVPAEARLLKDDPENRLLARGPRQRLTAEELRDNALFVSGLLIPRMGGAPVKPYQPAGLWEDSGTQHDYAQDHGDKLYRRSMYTFWRRTLPPPSMTIFDAPSREFCKVRRDKSSSPMQALVLFDDPQFMEAARVLAERLVRENPTDDAARVRTAYRLLTSTVPEEFATQALVGLLQDERRQFQASPQSAAALRSQNGERPPDPSLPAVEVAATTLLVRGLLAYDDGVMNP